MKNQAMQHAIASATKAHEKKTHTVGKGTLSLAGNMNKRSTDNPAGNQQKAETSMPQAAEAALVSAVQTLHDDATKEIAVNTTKAAEKPAETPNNVVEMGDIPAIVPRIDLLGNRVLFLVKTQNPDTGEIHYYNLKDGTVNVAPVEYYRSTNPVEQEDVISKMVNQFMSKTGSKNVILRKRLIKGHVLERDEDGKVDAKSVDTLKDNLLKALDQFRQAILSA